MSHTSQRFISHSKWMSMPGDAWLARGRWEPLALAAMLGVFFIVLYRSSWLSDDAYITFRTVHNFTNGYGMRWNIHERAQSFTHPLWFFLVSGIYFFTQEIFYSTHYLSLFLAMGALMLFACGRCEKAPLVLLLLLLLLFSKAFTEYASSGLETPLSYLLLAAFMLVYDRIHLGYGGLFLLSFIGALGMLNRLDAALLFMPMTAFAWCRLRDRRATCMVVLGMTPLALWFGFSLVYYGFLFPNTAYAKLGAGIPRSALIIQGLRYLQNTMNRDPVTPALMLSAVVLSLAARKGRLVPGVMGIMLYLLYTVAIGGDFMSGRFFALPTFLAVLLLAHAPSKRSIVSMMGAALIVFHVGTTLWDKPMPVRYSGIYVTMMNILDPHLIADERQCYIMLTGLRATHLRDSVPNRLPTRDYRYDAAALPSRVFECTSAGMTGYAAGPGAYIIERFALTNPLLARLPAKYEVPKWRIGHFERHIPEGYAETVRTGHNRLADPLLAEYYNHLTMVTRGPLFCWERLKTIVRFHCGAFDHLIVQDAYRFPNIKNTALSAVRDGDDELELLSPKAIPETGIHIALGMPRFDESITLEVDGGGYAVLFMRDDNLVAQTPPTPSSYFSWEGIAPGRTTIHVPTKARQQGFTAIRVVPTDTNKSYWINHVQFDNARQ